MANSVPQKRAFEISGRYSRCLSRIEVMGLFVSAFEIPVRFWVLPSCRAANILFSILSVLCVIGIFYFQRRFTTTYQKAEDIRRDGLFDDSFNTKLADTQSQEYYDTNGIDAGARKLLADVHENSFISTRVLEPSFKRKEGLSLGAFVCLIIIAVVNSASSQAFLAALQILLSANFLGDYYRVRDLQNALNDVQNNCKRIWDALEQNQKKRMPTSTEGEIIREVIRYETALAYASMMFSQRDYEDINDDATIEWDAMKKRYKM